MLDGQKEERFIHRMQHVKLRVGGGLGVSRCCRGNEIRNVVEARLGGMWRLSDHRRFRKPGK